VGGHEISGKTFLALSTMEIVGLTSSMANLTVETVPSALCFIIFKNATFIAEKLSELLFTFLAFIRNWLLSLTVLALYFFHFFKVKFMFLT
jgi:hypothetical protein